ncbi:MAG: mechanosensitive ion channel family protein [Candidatus Latescibacterota bacterium]|nr:MAG: mechanosensitive ion channel family protein [Candidatus Latescibacterota bacterium]
MIASLIIQLAAVPWYSRKFLNNAVWQWMALLGVIIVALMIGKIVAYFLNRQGQWLIEREKLKTGGMILKCLSRPTSMLILAGGLYISGTFMNLQISEKQDLRWFWMAACQTIAVLALGWAGYRLVDVLEVFLRKLTSKTRTQLDDQLVPIIRKALRIFVVIVVVLFIAQNIFRWDVGALLAGLGIGGLAFALAARDMLANFFGSVTIFTDRPFQMGERIKLQNYDGVVEQVGFRSTRIRTLDGHLVTIPNSLVANSTVENIGRRPYIRRVMNVTVTYDTSPEKLTRAVEIIREMLDARKEHFPPDKPGRVYFSEFNDCSLNIIVYYWFTPPDWWKYLEFTHDFNMELLRRFNEEGIEFAFPTQTLYVKQDSPFQTDVYLQNPAEEKNLP